MFGRATIRLGIGPHSSLEINLFYGLILVIDSYHRHAGVLSGVFRTFHAPFFTRPRPICQKNVISFPFPRLSDSKSQKMHSNNMGGSAALDI